MRSVLPIGATLAILSLPAMPALAAAPAPCPLHHMRVVRSTGGTIDYMGTVEGLPLLCREQRANDLANYYLGFWREDCIGNGRQATAP